LLFCFVLGEVRLDLPPVFRWFHFINTNYPILGSKRLLQVLQFYVFISNFNTSSAIIPAIPRNKWLQTKEVHRFKQNMKTWIHTIFMFINVFEQNYNYTPILCIWKARSTVAKCRPSYFLWWINYATKNNQKLISKLNKLTTLGSFTVYKAWLQIPYS
jgi:hypothetical protein